MEEIDSGITPEGGQNKFFENFSPELLQEMTEVFKTYKNAGASIETWRELLDNIEKGILSSDYQEAMSQAVKPEIPCYGITEEEAGYFRDFIGSTFSDELLKSALVSKVEVANDLVNVQLPSENPLQIGHGEYFIPIESFEKFWSSFNQEQQNWFSSHIYRGASFSNWFMENYSQGKYFGSPAVLYNQDYDTNNMGLIDGADVKDLGLEYLDSIPEEKRRTAYMNGTLAHEIAHNIYAYMIYNNQIEAEWKTLVDNIGNITNYANQYEVKIGARDYNENFAEAVRIYTTIPEYMNSESLSPIRLFISINFPNIKAA